jgi:hypothetical protein
MTEVTDTGAQSGSVGDGFLLAPLLLVSLPVRIVRARAACLPGMVDGAVGIDADSLSNMHRLLVCKRIATLSMTTWLRPGNIR